MTTIQYRQNIESFATHNPYAPISEEAEAEVEVEAKYTALINSLLVEMERRVGEERFRKAKMMWEEREREREREWEDESWMYWDSLAYEREWEAEDEYDRECEREWDAWEKYDRERERADESWMYWDSCDAWDAWDEDEREWERERELHAQIREWEAEDEALNDEMFVDPGEYEGDASVVKRTRKVESTRARKVSKYGHGPGSHKVVSYKVSHATKKERACLLQKKGRRVGNSKSRISLDEATRVAFANEPPSESELMHDYERSIPLWWWDEIERSVSE